MADVPQFFDKDYGHKEFSELAYAPVNASQWLSKANGTALKQALGTLTIRGVAEHEFVRITQATTVLSR